MVLHGYPRFTAALDLVVSLDAENATKALVALESLGFRPRAPVAMLAFADGVQRQRWIDEKGLAVFSLWNAASPLTEVDLFVKEPFPFDEAFARAYVEGVEICVASIDDAHRARARRGAAQGSRRHSRAQTAERRPAVTATEWNEHEIEQIRRWRETAPGERLRWLEEAKRFAAAVLASKKPPAKELLQGGDGTRSGGSLRSPMAPK